MRRPVGFFQFNRPAQFARCLLRSLQGEQDHPVLYVRFGMPGGNLDKWFERLFGLCKALFGAERTAKLKARGIISWIGFNGRLKLLNGTLAIAAAQSVCSFAVVL